MKIKQSYLKVGLVLTALTLLPLAHPAIAGDEVPYKGKEVGAITKGSFTASLAGSGPNVLKDKSGNPIAAFSKAFQVLYGDFTDDGVVDAADEAGVRANLTAPFPPIGLTTTTTSTGPGGVLLGNVIVILRSSPTTVFN